MLSKILIANRGEIAVRVIRACRELGIASVAVYSDLDRDACTSAWPTRPTRSAARPRPRATSTPRRSSTSSSARGADGVHPGYGFFSENTDFARAITARGVTFIGPPPEAIEVMGDKISSRIAAEEAGVAGVPGTTEFLTSADEVVAFGEEHGWPVAIKAAYGGGGRGMRVVQSADEAAAALESAQSEALKGFGRGECYVERYLTWPRHVEMQVIADTHGNAVWVGERDCSAQRRHQKLIEESPAPDFPDEIRQAMGEAAVKVAKACGYVNAGTVEFLYQDGEFFFLEMNTRLQVEHPVTELVTGHRPRGRADPRRRRASRCRSPRTTSTRRGHAIEVRINAEDPAGGKFLPSPGPITTLRVPAGLRRALGRRLRGRRRGQPVLRQPRRQAHRAGAATATTAIARMIRALEEFEIEGIATTIPADLAILAPPRLRGRPSTRPSGSRTRLDLSASASSARAPARRRRRGRAARAEGRAATSTSRSTAGASR